MTRREILKNIVAPFPNREPSCERLYGEKIDQALADLDKLDLTENEIKEIINNIGIFRYKVVRDGLTKETDNIIEVNDEKLAQAIFSAQRRKRGER